VHRRPFQVFRKLDLLVEVAGLVRTTSWWFSASGGALSPRQGRPVGPSAERMTGAVLALSDVCARVPMLISVRGPGWLRAGDIMRRRPETSS
jgi:hypothetical protein